jgi:diguanylate cyclase (GGDEF)-like protein
VRRLVSFRQWSILTKIMAISLMSVCFITAAFPLFFAPQMEQRLLEAKREGVKNVVDVSFGVLAEHDALVRAGQLGLEEAQRRAAQKLRGLRYGADDYFWINDLAARMVMHPARPELEGQDLTDYQDPDGKRLFREFVAVAKSSGSGFVRYRWPRPGGETPLPKLSYVRLYEPWGWIVGSGIYVEDVRREMAALRRVLVVGNVLFAAVTMTLAFVIGAGITRPLRRVIDGLKDIASGKGDIVLNKRIAISSIDEIGVLSSEFNGLMESIGRLTAFKKVIEGDDCVAEVYRRLGDVCSGQLGVRDCVVHEVADAEGRFVQAYPVAPAHGEARCDPQVAEDCERCKAKRTGQPISSLTYPGICRFFRGGPTEEHCCIPLVVGGSTVAVAQFVFDAGQGRAALRDAEGKLFKVEQYVKEALPVLETKRLTARLREASLRDPLTGLHNRRFLQEHAEKLVAGAARRGKKVGLVMCDLDHFKQVNDVHGHHAGDAVLRETAALIRRSVRASDLVVRFGGEEFLVVLLDVGEEDAVGVAEKIRQRIQGARLKLPDGTIHRTISLGVSEFPSDTDALWHCIRFADVALYRAKEAGRNRAVRFTPDMWTEEQDREQGGAAA